ncbi:MAG TPA: hypothetical protein PLD25_15630 [Chloroflexota bacterium]|nr:hypothetical protein [Chloroflexota bacterium]
MHRLRIPLVIIIGLALGLGLGLLIGWRLYPTEFVNATPAYLAPAYQQDYVRLVAAGYAMDRDLAAAQTRLGSLGENGEAVLTAVMIDAILKQQNEPEIRQLVNLAAAVGIQSPAMTPYLNPLPGETP